MFNGIPLGYRCGYRWDTVGIPLGYRWGSGREVRQRAKLHHAPIGLRNLSSMGRQRGACVAACTGANSWIASIDVTCEVPLSTLHMKRMPHGCLLSLLNRGSVSEERRETCATVRKSPITGDSSKGWGIVPATDL